MSEIRAAETVPRGWSQSPAGFLIPGAPRATGDPSLPEFSAVLAEQLRTVGMSLRREMAALAGILTLATASIVSIMMRHPSGAEFDLSPEVLTPTLLVALILPLAVWKSEGPGRRGYHRAMPVDHFTHALAKAFSGWVWLVAITGGYALWCAAMCVVTGGELSYPGWLWLPPIVGGSMLYALTTALCLVARHPWRWLAGTCVGWTVISSMADAMPALRPLERTLNSVLNGSYGLVQVLTGRSQGFGGYFFPEHDFRLWLTSAGVWAIGAVGALALAARRMPEE
jgi:hypothetical protein